MESKRTLVRMEVHPTQNIDASKWNAVLLETIDHKIAKFAVQVPPNAIVGKYQIFIETHKVHELPSLKPSTYRYRLPESAIVLFNPWLKGKNISNHA